MEDLSVIKSRIETEERYRRTRSLIAAFKAIISVRQSQESDQERIHNALDLMLQIHFRQKDRPDGQPYINHPLDVALHLTAEYKISDPEMVVAALLHDSVEDQAENLLAWGKQVPHQEDNLETQALQIIAAAFGENPANLIRRLTNPDFDAEIESLPVNNQDAVKAQLYLRHFEAIYNDDSQAFAIKMADFSQNALHLNRLAETPGKAWLQQKYGPVMLMVIEKLKELDDSSHPLFNAKEGISATLVEVYKRDYESPIHLR